jgi:hypothetical protein
MSTHQGRSSLGAEREGSIKLIRDTDPFKDPAIVVGWVEALVRLGLPE